MRVYLKLRTEPTTTVASQQSLDDLSSTPRSTSSEQLEQQERQHDQQQQLLLLKEEDEQDQEQQILYQSKEEGEILLESIHREQQEDEEETPKAKQVKASVEQVKVEAVQPKPRSDYCAVSLAQNQEENETKEDLQQAYKSPSPQKPEAAGTSSTKSGPILKRLQVASATPSSSSRKRRAATVNQKEDTGRHSPPPPSKKRAVATPELDQKPPAQNLQVTNGRSKPQAADTMVSGDRGFARRGWQYYHQDEEIELDELVGNDNEVDVRHQSPNDPAMDGNHDGFMNDAVEDIGQTEILVAENNPESARGDVFLPGVSAVTAVASAALPYAAAAGGSAAQASLFVSVAHSSISAAATPASAKLPSKSSNSNPSKRSREDVAFEAALKTRGLEVQEQDGDGNCLFRAISLQVYGDGSMHEEIRKRCMDFMERDQEHFSQFVTDEPFPQYIARKRQNGVHGNHAEIQAVSELFNRPVEVFTPENGATPINIFHAEYKTADAPIRLSYHDGNHYNAVIDPLVPTAGLGLGLPGLQPGLADKMQMAKAVAESDAAADQMELSHVLKSSEDDEVQRALKSSEDDELQRAIKESKLSAEHMFSHAALSLSDADATYFELEQTALEHSINSYRQNESDKKQSASTTAAKRKKDDLESSASGAFEEAEKESSTTGSDFASAEPSSVASVPSAGVASMPAAASYASAASASASASVAVACTVAAAAAPSPPVSSPDLRPMFEYPDSVQELVMNGFPLSSVVKVMEIVGPSFDDMLALLMANQR